MSNMSNAVVAGSRTTGTGSGGDGICSVGGGLVMGELPDYNGAGLHTATAPFFEARRKKSWMPSAGISAFIISPLPPSAAAHPTRQYRASPRRGFQKRRRLHAEANARWRSGDARITAPLPLTRRRAPRDLGLIR